MCNEGRLDNVRYSDVTTETVDGGTLLEIRIKANDCVAELESISINCGKDLLGSTTVRGIALNAAQMSKAWQLNTGLSASISGIGSNAWRLVSPTKARVGLLASINTVQSIVVKRGAFSCLNTDLTCISKNMDVLFNINRRS